MSGFVFDQAELRKWNRRQAWLCLAMLDFRSARRFLNRNKRIRAAERIEERIGDVN